MWYLTHRDPKDNSSVYSSLLLRGKKYTIGRSKKSNFVLHSPSVSSNHLAAQIDDSGALELSVFGKSTYIGADYIDRRTYTPDQAKVPEIRRIKKSETVLLSSGKLASVGLRYRKLFLCVASDAVIDEPTLRSMGISTSNFFSSDTTYMVVNVKRRSTTQLEALIRQIPILSVDYAQQLINSKEDLIENFEENFPDHSPFLIDPKCAPNPQRKTLFQGFTFIFTEPTQFEVMEPVLIQAMSHCALFSFTDSCGANDYVSFVNKEVEKTQNVPILVQMTALEPEFLKSHADLDRQTPEVKQMAVITEGSKRLGLYLVTTDDVFKAILDTSTTHLERKRPQRTKSPEPEVRVPSLKKARRGAKLKPLDSLDFFAGGVKTETQQQSQPIPEIKESVEREPLIPQKRQRSRIKPLDNQMLDTNFSPPLGIEESQTGSASIDVPSSITKPPQPPATQVTSPQAEVRNNDLVKDEISDSEEEEPLKDIAPPVHKRRPLEEQNTSQQQQSFSSAIIQAKKRADERIKKEFGSDLPLEDDLAVEHLRDLAIVEETDMPLRKAQDRSQELSQSQRWDPQWNGRKNFKMFVKNTKNKEGYGIGRIGSVREFVSFDVYDPAYDLKITELDEDLLAIVQKGEAERAEQAGTGMSSTVTFNATRQPTVADPRPKKAKNSLFVASDESDDDYEDTRFHFGTEADDGLGMGLRVNDPQKVPEYRREFNPGASTHVSVNGTPTKTSGPQSMRTMTTSASTSGDSRPSTRRNLDEDDDDDDDDDIVDGIPRFRFG